jgi:Sulfotransferase family
MRRYNLLTSLLFGARKENNAMVRGGSPLKARVSHGRDEEENRSPTGDAWPDFLCVGGQRSGTTWLYRQLKSHPDFWMPPVKELHYFDELSRTKRASPPRLRDERDLRFLESIKSLSARSYIDLDNYARLFEAKGSLLSGDITPAYSMLNDEIIQRIVSYFPSLKVIFLARDPVERVWSQLSLAVSSNMIRPFDINDVAEVTRNLLHPGVLLRSHPSKIVARWRRHVHPDLFRICFFDDLETNPAELRRSILHFLGTDPDKPNGRIMTDHAARQKLRLTEKMRSHVAEFFRKELNACATELGGPARDWPARYGFSLLWFFIGLADDDLLFWCDWFV